MKQFFINWILPIIVTAPIIFCFVWFANADEKLTKEQALVLKIEQVQNVRDYSQEQMDKLETQYRSIQALKLQAERELNVLNARLDKMKGKK